MAASNIWSGNSWAVTPDWYLDPTNGSDSYRGDDPARALKTIDELVSRIGDRTLLQRTTVHQRGDYSTSELALRLRLTAANPFVWMTDSDIWTPVATGTITGATAVNRTAALPNAQMITDSGVASWVPYIGVNARIRITGGNGDARKGAVAFPMKDFGSGQVRTTRFCGVGWDPSTALSVQQAVVDVAVGDTYVIEALPGLKTVRLTVERDVADINNQLAPRAILDAVAIGEVLNSSVGRSMGRIEFSGAPHGTYGGGIIEFSRSLSFLTGAGADAASWAQNVLWINTVNWSGGGALSAGGVLKGLGASTLIFGGRENSSALRNDWLVQGSLLGGSYINTDLVGFSIWDTTGTAVELFAGDVLEVRANTVLYGANFGDDGIQVEPGGVVRYTDVGAINLRAVPSDVSYPGRLTTGHDIEVGAYSTPVSSDDLTTGLTAPFTTQSSFTAANPSTPFGDVYVAGGSAWDKDEDCGVLRRGTD